MAQMRLKAAGFIALASLFVLLPAAFAADSDSDLTDELDQLDQMIEKRIAASQKQAAPAESKPAAAPIAPKPAAQPAPKPVPPQAAPSKPAPAPVVPKKPAPAAKEPIVYKTPPLEFTAETAPAPAAPAPAPKPAAPKPAPAPAVPARAPAPPKPVPSAPAPKPAPAQEPAAIPVAPPDDEGIMAPPPGRMPVAEPSRPAESDSLEKEIQSLDKEIQKRVKISGKYRFNAGVGRHRTFSFNDATADLQDRDAHYLFGERLNNTFDPAIFNQYQVDVEADVTDKLSLFSQITADPWSYVAVSGDQTIHETGGIDSVNINLKYFGSNNSTISEIYRAHFRNFVSTPDTEAVDGKIPSFRMNGINDLGLSYLTSDIDLDYTFRPVRKLWADYKEDIWHVRAFALADEKQAMTTDDPLGLSNNHDFWQPSPWLAKWIPIKRFADMNTPDVNGSIQRGHYSDVEAYNALSSYGEHLTLLRGAAMEADFGRAYVGGMIAAPLSPWESYEEVNNVPGVVRLKHQVTPQWMVGSLYGFRVGLIDKEPDAFNQVISFDTKYALSPETEVYGQVAGSRDEIDRLSQGMRRSEFGFESSVEGMAWRGGLKSEFKHWGGGSNLKSDFTWMGQDFRPHLSQYRAQRDDNFWGRHITFHKYTPDLEYYRIGTGVDIGRYTGRSTLNTALWNERLENLFDVRHVRSSDKNSFVENVVRDEMTYKITPQLRAKGFTRWVVLPKTESDVEPLLGDFAFIDAYNLPAPKLQNDFVDPGLDADRFTLAGGLQYEPNEVWTFEGSYTRTNDIPDFPRGLQNNVFLRAPTPDPENPNVLIDQAQYFLYRQDIYDLPPYDYFSIVKERVIFRPEDNLKFTFHAAQNSYKLWGPIDEMMNHQGLSIDYDPMKQVSLFFDYTHSVIGDVPKLISTGFTELDYRSHHNFFANLRYQINKSTRLNVSYGVFGETFIEDDNDRAKPTNAFSVSEFSLPTIDTEQLVRIYLDGEF